MEVKHRQPLSRERILGTALELVDEEGLDRLTMRRLGLELGVEAMSLYRYVPNKRALLTGLVELLLSELEVPGPQAGDWRARLRGTLDSYTDIADRHPEAFKLLLGRPPFTQKALRPAEELLEILRAAGFEAKSASVGLVTLFSFADGFLATRIAMIGDEQVDPSLRGGLPPDLTGLPRHEEALAFADELHDLIAFRAGVELILDGLARLAPS